MPVQVKWFSEKSITARIVRASKPFQIPTPSQAIGVASKLTPRGLIAQTRDSS
jgi:hypothetical protein